MVSRQDDETQKTDRSAVRSVSGKCMEEIFQARAPDRRKLCADRVSAQRVNFATRTAGIAKLCPRRNPRAPFGTGGRHGTACCAETGAQLEKCQTACWRKTAACSTRQIRRELTAFENGAGRAPGNSSPRLTKRPAPSAQKLVKDLSAQIDTLRGKAWTFRETPAIARRCCCSAPKAEFKQIQDRIWEEYELTYAGAEAFRQADFKLTEAEKRVSQIRQRIRQMGSVNVAAVDEYRQTLSRVEELSAQRDDLNAAIADLEKIIAELEKHDGFPVPQAV